MENDIEKIEARYRCLFLCDECEYKIKNNIPLQKYKQLDLFEDQQMNKLKFAFQLLNGEAVEVTIPRCATASELKTVRKKIDRYLSLLIAQVEPAN